MLVLGHFGSKVYGLAVAIGSAHRLRSIGLLCEQQLQFVLRLLSFVLSDNFFWLAPVQDIPSCTRSSCMRCREAVTMVSRVVYLSSPSVLEVV